MTDLIERPFIAGEGGCPSCVMKDAEIERLTAERDGVVALYNASVKRVEQLQAVVDAVTGGIPSEITEALAAAETDE